MIVTVTVKDYVDVSKYPREHQAYAWTYFIRFFIVAVNFLFMFHNLSYLKYLFKYVIL
jgi:hypothetical protein